MKIAHLSDLHICQKSRPGNLEKTRSLIDYALRHQADHFVFTGDIAHLAEKADFLAFRDLLREFDLLDAARSTLVIGNHDIFGGVYYAEDILAFPQKCQTVDYEKKLLEFKHFFFETFESCYFPVSHQPYPFAKIIGNVAFIGLNSIYTYSLLQNLLASKGMVNKDQQAGLRQILARKEYQDKVKIVLIHHHFNKVSHRCSVFTHSLLRILETYGHKLIERKKLAQLLRKLDVALVLHGHEHDSHEYSYKGLHFMSAGGCIEKNHADELRINWIEIKADEIKTEIQTVRSESGIQPGLALVRQMAGIV